MKRSDAFIVLPGGVGSLDELAEIMANNQLQESFFVSGGLVMLKDKTCEVLVDQIESLGDVNSSNYQQTKTYQELEGNESAQGTFEQVINSPSYK